MKWKLRGALEICYKISRRTLQQLGHQTCFISSSVLLDPVDCKLKFLHCPSSTGSGPLIHNVGLFGFAGRRARNWAGAHGQKASGGLRWCCNLLAWLLQKERNWVCGWLWYETRSGYTGWRDKHVRDRQVANLVRFHRVVMDSNSTTSMHVVNANACVRTTHGHTAVAQAEEIPAIGMVKL